MEDSYYKRNKQRILETVKLYQSTRKEHYKQKYREWYAVNKDKVNARRREKKMEVPKVKKEKVKKEPVVEMIPLTVPESVEPVIVVSQGDFILTFE